jgi:RNA polymerase sigma-70 factor (ECF subfamily)
MIPAMTTSSTPDGSAADLFERHGARIRRYIHRMVRNEADADELLQETFLRVARSLPEFRGEAMVTTWIYGIATNVCRDFFRRRDARGGKAARSLDEMEAEQGRGLEALAGAPALTPDALFDASEMGECIREFVDGLPDTYRAALVLHDLEGLSNPEIGGILHWSLDKVKITVHRGRRRLKETLERKCTFYRDERNVLRCDRKGPTCE